MPGLQSLTEDEAPEGEADKPGQYPPGATCMICGSKDTEIGDKSLAPGAIKCNNCGTIYDMHVMVEIKNPENLSTKDKDKGGKVEAPEEPSLPSMPVAASIKLDKDSLTKIASCEEQFGHVCPGCGQTDCKPKIKVAGHTEYTCPACETAATKDIMVDQKDPKNAELRVAWTVNPYRQAFGDCVDCKQEAKKLAAKLYVNKLLKQAELNNKKSPFPKANCLERIARKWGADATATIGPCKGKPLADCVCQELEKLGFTDGKLMRKLAETYSQPDPMDECIAAQTAQFNKRVKDVKVATAMACDTCKALFNKHAKKHHKNLLLQAWAQDFSEGVLDEMDKNLHPIEGEETAPVAALEDEGDLRDPLPPLPEKETITVEISVEEAEKVADQVEAKKTEEVAAAAPAPEVTATETEGALPPVKEDVDSLDHPDAPSITATTNTATTKTITVDASQKEGKTMQKEAAKPTQVEHIDKGNATVPRKEQLLGNEGKADSMINKSPATPNIPRSDAKMGEESKVKGGLNTANALPDVPTQGEASLIKGEKGTLDGSVNTQIKGTVVADAAENLQKEAAKPTKVETIEGNVEAKVPRSNQTLGNEGKDNIDVKMDKPNIPSGKATMGNEGADNIDVKADLPDVPVDSSHMGGEAEAQKGMPAINNEIKGTVIASGQKHRDRIAEARFKKAQLIAGRFMAAGRIKENEYEQMVEDLALHPIDRMEAFASRIYGTQQVKVASVMTNAAVPPAWLTSGVVQEASVSSPVVKDERQTLVDSLAANFTVGSRDLDAELRKRGER
jgi:transcription elongation factor Elf1